MLSPRTALYRLHWEARSRAAGFGLMQAIRLVAESERWERRRLDELRDEKLVRVVEHAYRASPHYRRMMDERGVKPADVRGLLDLPKLPVLTKDALRRHADELRFREDVPVEVGATGGTTGNPIRIVRDRAGSVWQRACYWRGFGWGGLGLGDAFVQLFGGTLGVAKPRPLDRAKNWFSGKHFLPAFELGPHNVARYLDAIRGSGARFLVGYTSAVYLLASHAEKTGARVALDAVFPTAELLLDSWRETMARAFGARVLPYYGCGEVESLGYSCPTAETPVYHTCDEHSVIEVAPEADEEGVGASLVGEGVFLISDLDNHAFPMLRYRNGDAGALAPPGCSCGRTLGRITRIDGRVNDVLYTSAGAAISGAIGPHAFKMVDGVEQFQIVQRRRGQIVIVIVRLDGYDAAREEAKLGRVFRQHLGAETEIEFRYVEAIPRTPAGKARFIINEVGAP
jgi:phenylacetate-coenzyme A ligase PaaK-like adenylate-forming protein